MNYRNAFLALVSLLIFASPLRGEDLVKTAVTDLEALAARGQWSEAMGRVEEIDAAERDTQWERVVAKIAAGHMTQLVKDKSAGRDAVAVTLSDRYPFLAHSAAFVAQRDAAIIGGYQDCVAVASKEKDCSLELTGRIAQVPVHAKLIVDATEATLVAEGSTVAKKFLADQFARVPAAMKTKIRKDEKLAPLFKRAEKAQ